jgi:hypothetical protein
MVNGDDLIFEARKFRGAPWFHAGRDEQGIDCVGLILVPARRLGLTDYEPPSYSPIFDPGVLLRVLGEQCERVGTLAPLSVYADPPAGTIGLFVVRGHPTHLGYLTGEGTVIHAHAKAKRVIEEPLAGLWERCLMGIYRWRNVAC